MPNSHSVVLHHCAWMWADWEAYTEEDQTDGNEVKKRRNTRRKKTILFFDRKVRNNSFVFLELNQNESEFRSNKNRFVCEKAPRTVHPTNRFSAGNFSSTVRAWLLKIGKTMIIETHHNWSTRGIQIKPLKSIILFLCCPHVTPSVINPVSTNKQIVQALGETRGERLWWPFDRLAVALVAIREKTFTIWGTWTD